MQGETIVLERILLTQHVWKHLIFDFNFSQRLLCYFLRVSGNCTDCLALVDDPVFGEESLVSNREAIGQVREVIGGHRGPDAGI